MDDPMDVVVPLARFAGGDPALTNEQVIETRLEDTAKTLYRSFQPPGDPTLWRDLPDQTQRFYLGVARGISNLLLTGRYTVPLHTRKPWPGEKRP